MFVVRFPTGVSITYNNANFLKYNGDTAWELYTKDPAKGGQWVASVSPQSGCTVEAITACKVENPTEQLTNDRALKFVSDNIRTFNGRHRSDLRRLKSELTAYNSKAGEWRST